MESCSKILQERCPKAQKSLGKTVHNYSHSTWMSSVDEIVIRGLRAKFGQNKHLEKFLLETENNQLAEASFDKTWGVGLSLRDPKIWEASNHTGSNKLGKLLMQVRAELRK
jgi:ribA/ribD-fused uncharacterized protein